MKLILDKEEDVHVGDDDAFLVVRAGGAVEAALPDSEIDEHDNIHIGSAFFRLSICMMLLGDPEMFEKVAAHYTAEIEAQGDDDGEEDEEDGDPHSAREEGGQGQGPVDGGAAGGL
jgi:hypothetical protein